MAPTGDAIRGLAVDERREARDQRMRAAALVLLLAFVLAGLGDVLGVRTRTRVGGSPDLEIAVTHPQVARPGLAAPFDVLIRRPGGFDGPIVVTVTTAYLQMFDENGFEPDPASSTTGAMTTSWTFDPPDGEELRVWLDARIEPGVQWKRTGRVHVEADGARATVDLTTWIFP